jgi:anti-anti-sigma factor
MAISDVVSRGVPPQQFEVRHRPLGRRAVAVSVSGEVDLVTGPALRSALVELSGRGYCRYVLDLSGVRHMDSTGLAVLIGFRERLPEDDALVVVVAAAGNVRALFEMTGLDERFAMCPTLDVALAGLPGVDPPPEPPVLNEDAALAVGLASTALPFVESQTGEVQRWLRILRLHGDAGRALRGLELIEAPRAALESLAAGERVSLAAAGSAQRIDEVVAHAKELAAARGARAVGTGHVLEAVIAVYGVEFDRVLRLYGGDRSALIERLASETA